MKLRLLFVLIGLLVVSGLADMLRADPAPLRRATPARTAAGGPALLAGQALDGDGPAPGVPPGTGAGQTDGDAQRLQDDEAWRRLSYPTGIFNPHWLQAAARADSRMALGVPAGQVIYSRHDNPSPLALDPTRFTALGPAPLETDDCQNCWTAQRATGRINTIAVNPANTAIAYAGSVAGGVWKTTNCCSPTTSWTLTSDNPLINVTFIGDIALDPNNPNIVYASTGDSQKLWGDYYGSQGILKSTDAGASWVVVGADTFAFGMIGRL